MEAYHADCTSIHKRPTEGEFVILDDVRLVDTSIEDMEYTFPFYVDGKNVNSGDRILMINRSPASKNGIWVIGDDGTLKRSDDLKEYSCALGITVHVSDGDINGDTYWTCVSGITVSVGGLKFEKIDVDWINTNEMPEREDSDQALYSGYEPSIEEVCYASNVIQSLMDSHEFPPEPDPIGEESLDATNEENVNAEMLCAICLERKKNSLLMPCRHLCVCDVCSKVMSKDRHTPCPICRSIITDYITVYL